ncbi:MAG: helix-turn-helix domain-containing protein [Lachnospiraceae bacterium]|nr:helix-turn-helix domain-containing protein [Lachnospiraceae bacterium]
MERRYVTPDHLTSEDIKELRAALDMTQSQLAVFLRVSKRTVERWETSKEPITGAIVTLADILLRNPEMEEKLRLKDNRLKLRLKYFYKNMMCTVIDVDELQRKVEIKNYVKNPMLRAFGVNNEPDYDDYEQFLESRCFPRTRDKMKLELKRLDIPFYDPILIIEKTLGRMEEDEFYIEIER